MSDMHAQILQKMVRSNECLGPFINVAPSQQASIDGEHNHFVDDRLAVLESCSGPLEQENESRRDRYIRDRTQDVDRLGDREDGVELGEVGKRIPLHDSVPS